LFALLIWQAWTGAGQKGRRAERLKGFGAQLATTLSTGRPQRIGRIPDEHKLTLAKLTASECERKM